MVFDATTPESTAVPLSRIDAGATIQEQVTQRLREAIAFGRFQPGARLVQGELAEALGVSREPVRQALSVLEGEGLVVTVARRGTLVSQFSLEDVEQIAEVRAALEHIAAKRAATRLTPEQLDRLRWLLGEGRRYVEANDTIKLIEMDRAFHREIYIGSGNRRLVDVLETEWVHITRFMCLYLSIAGLSARAWQEHEVLFEALAARDARRAGRLVEAHVGRAARDVVLALSGRLEEQESPGDTQRTRTLRGFAL